MVPRAPARITQASRSIGALPQIPLVDLRAEYASIRSEIDEAIHRVLPQGRFILGPEVESLEQELAASCGVAHAVAVGSGTDALILALRACGIRPGDEVVTPAVSFFATAEAILAVGAVPVFADIDPATCTLDPAQVEACLTPRTAALLPVHLYGHPCDMEPLLALARARRLKVIEDAAQAIGARIGGRPVGSFGDAAALSFYPTKNLGAYGDGGMVLTDDAAVAEQVRLLRGHGSRGAYQHVAIGLNSRLDELQAAVLRVKLRHLDAWTQARRSHAQRYAEAFRRHRLESLARLPEERAGATHVYHRYVIRTPQRDRLLAALAHARIECQVAYPSTLPSQPALAAITWPRASYPNAEALCRDNLSLPIYPQLTPALIDRIVEAIADALRQEA